MRSACSNRADGSQPAKKSQRTLQFFADRVEGNLLAAHQEIQKLGLLYPAGAGEAPAVLSFDQVENAVLNVARYDVFKLSEAVLGGQALRVQRMLDGLQSEGESEVLVHWALAEDIRSMKRVKDAPGRTAHAHGAAREPCLGHQGTVRTCVAARSATPRWPTCCTRRTRLTASSRASSGRIGPPTRWQALQRLALRLCRACAGQKPAARI